MLADPAGIDDEVGEDEESEALDDEQVGDPISGRAGRRCLPVRH